MRASAGTFPTNTAPYTKVVYLDSRTGRRVRRRISADLKTVALEESNPIRQFPSYRGKRAHHGNIWFETTRSHVPVESYFEAQCLVVVDYIGNVRKLSSNPLWLVWPAGTVPQRHAPDLFAKLSDGSILVIDVHPQELINDRVQRQHDLTARVCRELGWNYAVFSSIDPVIWHNISVIAGYRRPRYGADLSLRAAISSALDSIVSAEPTMGRLIEDVSAGAHDRARTTAAVFHMIWRHELNVNVDVPPTSDSKVWK